MSISGVIIVAISDAIINATLGVSFKHKLPQLNVSFCCANFRAIIGTSSGEISAYAGLALPVLNHLMRVLVYVGRALPLLNHPVHPSPAIPRQDAMRRNFSQRSLFFVTSWPLRQDHFSTADSFLPCAVLAVNITLPHALLATSITLLHALLL